MFIPACTRMTIIGSGRRNMKTKRWMHWAVSFLLVLALLLPLFPLPARAELNADAGRAYLDVLRANSPSIPVKPWMGIIGRTEDLKSVAFPDLDGDGTPELVFLTAEDNASGMIFGKHVILNIYTYADGAAKQLCAEEISYGGGTTPHYFKVYRNRGQSALFALGGWSHALESESTYFMFALENGAVVRRALLARQGTYELNGETVSETEYQRYKNEMSGPIAEVLIDSESANSAQSGMTEEEAEAYLFSATVSHSINVTVNGETVAWTDAAPFIDENDRTMVPLRAVGEALGLVAYWDAPAREAVFSDRTRSIIFPIGSAAARTGDGGTVEMDTAAVIVNSRTYAPIRYLAEYFGYTVGWDAATRTAMIQSPADGGLDSADVVWKRMNHSYRQADDVFGDTFVNCYYDLAAITDQTPLQGAINAALRSGYEAFLLQEDVGEPYAGGFDEGETNLTNGRSGELAQNADGILSLKYTTDWMMGGVGDGSPSGVTVSLKTGRLLRLGDLTAADGSAITFRRMEDLAVACYRERGVPEEYIASSLTYFREKTLNDLDYYIVNNQIILCIAKYALAPGAAGSAEIPTGIFVRV